MPMKNRAGFVRLMSCMVISVAAALLGLFNAPASAQTRIINDGGGQCSLTDATGGLRIHVGANSQLQVQRCAANGTTAPLIVVQPAGVACALSTNPGTGGTGPVAWTCTGSMASGQTGIVSFEVVVDE